MEEFPKELPDFLNFTIEGENWWDGNELIRIDVSGNLIQSVPEEIVNQVTVQTFSLMGNLLKNIPDSIYSM
jgi:hypothetical protein